MDNAVRILNDMVLNLPDSHHDLHMETLIEPAVAALPALLAQTPTKALYIDYETPYLMRIAYLIGNQHKKAFLSCHYFFGENYQDVKVAGTPLVNPYRLHGRKPVAGNLYHSHSWGTSFKLFDGSYRQKIGTATRLGLDAPPETYVIVRQDAADPETNHYAFNNPLTWHEVMPENDKPVSTLMMTYTPSDWRQIGPTPLPEQTLRPLTLMETNWMKNHFRNFVQPR